MFACGIVSFGGEGVDTIRREPGLTTPDRVIDILTFVVASPAIWHATIRGCDDTEG